VLGHGPEDSIKVELVALESLQEAIHAEGVPPSILPHNHEAASKDVTDITASTNVGRKRPIRDDNQNSAGVIQNNV